MGGRVTTSWFIAFVAGLEVHNVTHDWMMAAYVLRHGRSGAWRPNYDAVGAVGADR